MISSTWAAMLALGSGLGGIVTAKLGVEVAFLINAATYVVSAVCIATVPIPAPKPGTHAAATAPRHRTWRTFVQGMRYMQGHPQVRRLLSVKAWSAGVGGSIILLSTLFAEEVYEAGVTGIGSLYMVRGVGAVCGPILARGIVDEDPQAMSRTIGVSFFIMGGLYALFSRMPTLQSAAGVLCVATMASNVLWVFSSTLLQVGVPDVYRGRVFATDFALLTIVMALSTLVTGWTLDHLGLSPRPVTLWLGVLLCLPGLLWLLPRCIVRRVPCLITGLPSRGVEDNVIGRFQALKTRLEHFETRLVGQNTFALLRARRRGPRRRSLLPDNRAGIEWYLTVCK